MSMCKQELSSIKLPRRDIETLQLNLGMICNQSCVHCHHNAGPGRTELMPVEICLKVLHFFEVGGIPTVELTGGSPELNPNFKDIIEQVRAMERKVIVRSNLTVLFEGGMEGVPQFLAKNRVELVCSLPCYLEQNVDAQRGKGAYKKSIAALKLLNDLGYGVEGSGLLINLVYNPGGSFLPGDQLKLEADYRRNLSETHGIEFNHLYTITNMPIGRFEKQLYDSDAYEGYMDLLRSSSNYDLLGKAMCCHLVSIGWDGRVYDCDFNQALGLPVRGSHKKLWEYARNELIEEPVILGEHCYGCIAGSGSSCTGALSKGSLN